MITLQQILTAKSSVLDNARVKVVRHKDNRPEYKDVMKDKKQILEYQKIQGKDIFKDCDYIISFIGIERGRSVFLGVFKVGASIMKDGVYEYELENVPEFREFEDRLIIDWGGSTISWHQWYDKHGDNPHINNVQLGKHGRNRTNVWETPGCNTMRKGRLDDLAMHPTVKPVPLVAEAIKDCSNRGGIILDPFGGSGTTLIACEKTGRKARLIEIDPKYVDVTIRRWQSLTGQKAVLSSTGQYFDDLNPDNIQLSAK